MARSSCTEARRRARGTSFIEVLIAMAILTLLIAGILQMFSLSLAVSQSSAARTQMTYKAQQVAETIRFVQFVSKTNPTFAAQAQIMNGNILPIAVGSRDLPYRTSDAQFATQFGFWGPQGAAVIDGSLVDGAMMPYKLSYRVTDNATTWGITVTAAAVPAGSGGASYSGSGLQQKKVEYVTYLPK